MPKRYNTHVNQWHKYFKVLFYIFLEVSDHVVVFTEDNPTVKTLESLGSENWFQQTQKKQLN